MQIYGVKMKSEAFNIMDYHALPDGITDNASSIKMAIDDCSAKGGGTVLIPSGKFLSGPIRLKSNINLFLNPGAVLSFIDDPDAYDVVETRWEGTECFGLEPMISGNRIENVSVSGYGTIDGMGKKWWDKHRDIKKGIIPDLKILKIIGEKNRDILRFAASGGGGLETNFLRPSLIQFRNCDNVVISGVTLRNSAFWNTHILYCRDVEIHNVKFVNPDDSPNTDGIDVDSSRCVRISDCLFDVGDDCICLKSGSGEDGRRVGIPTEIVTVTNCVMYKGHGGIVFGSECAGGIRNVTVNNCIFNGTDRGIRIKSRRTRGGYIENLNISNIIMENTISPLVFNLFYKCGANTKDVGFLNDKTPQKVDEGTPWIRNVKISGISSYKTKSSCGVFMGLPEMPIENVVCDNILVEMDQAGEFNSPAMNFDDTRMKKSGFYGMNLKNFRFSDIELRGITGPGFVLTGGSDIDIGGLRMIQEDASKPEIIADGCEGLRLSDCRVNGKSFEYEKE
jgi:polygalacturonase